MASKDANKLNKLKVSDSIIQDATNIFNGVYAPLVGFLREKDFQSVLDNMRLANGQVWSMPIIIDIGEDDYSKLKNEKKVILIDADDKARVVLDNIEIYGCDKNELAKKVYGTLDKNPIQA